MKEEVRSRIRTRSNSSGGFPLRYDDQQKQKDSGKVHQTAETKEPTIAKQKSQPEKEDSGMQMILAQSYECNHNIYFKYVGKRDEGPKRSRSKPKEWWKTGGAEPEGVRVKSKASTLRSSSKSPTRSIPKKKSSTTPVMPKRGRSLSPAKSVKKREPLEENDIELEPSPLVRIYNAETDSEYKTSNHVFFLRR
jgi:hypothetical protein